jgi:hypothetical protein
MEQEKKTGIAVGKYDTRVSKSFPIRLGRFCVCEIDNRTVILKLQMGILRLSQKEDFSANMS